MARVVMFVMNPVSFDSRVLREAATLAAAGHEVTLVGTDDPHAALPVAERRDGFELLRVARPTAWRERWRATVVRPSRLWRGGGRRVLNGARRLRPGEVLRGAGDVLAGLAMSVVRKAWLVVRRPEGGDAAWPPEEWTFLATWRYAFLGWATAAAAAAPLADVYHGHDLTGLPAAIRAAARNGGRIVYDSHEIFLESGRYAARPRWIKAIFRRLERRWSAGTAALVTVNRAYGEVIARSIRPKRVVVVHNCPPRTDPPAGSAPDRLRGAMGIEADAPVVLYHGAFAAFRGMEQLAAAAPALAGSGTHVAFLGYGAQRPLLERLAAEDAAGRLHVLEAVSPDELLDWIRTADVDAIPLQHSTLNHYLCTPNKLFESLAVGVPVVVSDFPEMRRIVMDDPLGPLGAVCDPHDPSSVAAALLAILAAPPEERRMLRERCRRAAHERWNWETEGARLVELYADLADEAGAPAMTGQGPAQGPAR